MAPAPARMLAEPRRIQKSRVGVKKILLLTASLGLAVSLTAECSDLARTAAAWQSQPGLATPMREEELGMAIEQELGTVLAPDPERGFVPAHRTVLVRGRRTGLAEDRVRELRTGPERDPYCNHRIR